MSIYYNPGHISREWFHCILLALLVISHVVESVLHYIHTWCNLHVCNDHSDKFGRQVRRGYPLEFAVCIILLFSLENNICQRPYPACICTAVHRFSSKMLIKFFKEWHHSVPETTLSGGGPGVYYFCSNKHFRQHTCTVQQACMPSIWQYWGYEYTLPAWFEVCVCMNVDTV